MLVAEGEIVDFENKTDGLEGECARLEFNFDTRSTILDRDAWVKQVEATGGTRRIEADRIEMIQGEKGMNIKTSDTGGKITFAAAIDSEGQPVAVPVVQIPTEDAPEPAASPTANLGAVFGENTEIEFGGQLTLNSDPETTEPRFIRMDKRCQDRRR